MDAVETLPWRGTGEAPLDPARLPRMRGLRPLKRWRYVGVYGGRVQLCAGVVRIAGAPQSFWAVHHRDGGVFRERTVLRKAVGLDDGTVRFHGRGVTAELKLVPAGERVAVVSRHGAHPVWTRKTPLRVTGELTIDGVAVPVDAPGLQDDSAGHHARVTRWSWSAGCGTAADGGAVTWNLVDGLHDAATSSERTVWVDGVAREVPPVAFAPDLSSAGDLRFEVEAERARHDRLLVVDSAYRQPFGTFTGTLPGGVVLREGYGVMERHDVRW
ncbi:DUF2804 domain-containing protein [Amycolatopsis minnesotensis]